MILRGGSEQFLEETERSLHDAIMIVRRTIRNDSVIAGKCRFAYRYKYSNDWRTNHPVRISSDAAAICYQRQQRS